MKIHLLILVYFYLEMLFYESSSEKKCFAPGSCSLQIGGKDISCNLTESTINYHHDDESVDTTSIPVRNLKQEYFPYEDNQTFTWIDISGEFEITGNSSVNHILIMMNEKNQSEKGKSYHLTFDSEMLSNGIQNFNISCLHTEKYNAQNIPVIPLISFENNSLTSSDLPVNNEDICKNECLKNWLLEGIVSISNSQEVQIDINSTDKCNTTFEVTLYNAMDHHNCSNNSVHAVRLQRQTVTIQGQKRLSFSSLQPGNYCATIYPTHGECITRRCCSRCCTGLYTTTVNLTEPKHEVSTSPRRQITTLSPEYVITIVVATVCGLMAAGIILYLKYLRHQTMIVNRKYVSSTTDQVTNIEAQLQIINQKLPKSRILLLYSLENSGMDNVVLQFIKVLEECCFCKVIHTMNDNEINEIIKKSPSGWILYNIRHVDKIILIESQNTYHMQQCWINSEIIELPSNEDSALLSGFITIHNRECLNDYNQLAVVRFNFTPRNIKLEDVVESCRYILPSSLSALFLFIHSKKCNTSNNPETETLILSTEALQSFWKKESSVFNSFLQICQKNECNSSWAFREPIISKTK